jgi:hypothetical protein
VTRALNRGEQDTLKAKLVASKRGDGFLEELLRMLVACINTADIYLLPFNRNVVGLEDGLD